MLDRLREWWERLAPRERGLFSLLGATAVVLTLVYVGYTVSSSMSEIEEHNQAMHDALKNLDEHRDDLMGSRGAHGGDVTALIGDEAQPLATYLEEREKEIGVKIGTTTEKPPATKNGGKFRELAVQINLTDVTLDQLANFAKSIETKSPTVVTQRLYVKRSSLHKEKIDRVELTVATYERAKKAGEKATADAGGTETP